MVLLRNLWCRLFHRLSSLPRRGHQTCMSCGRAVPLHPALGMLNWRPEVESRLPVARASRLGVDWLEEHIR